jgi:hypothetical protein
MLYVVSDERLTWRPSQVLLEQHPQFLQRLVVELLVAPPVSTVAEGEAVPDPLDQLFLGQGAGVHAPTIARYRETGAPFFSRKKSGSCAGLFFSEAEAD